MSTVAAALDFPLFEPKESSQKQLTSLDLSRMIFSSAAAAHSRARIPQPGLTYGIVESGRQGDKMTVAISRENFKRAFGVDGSASGVNACMGCAKQQLFEDVRGKLEISDPS